jgi:hypothetical protein
LRLRPGLSRSCGAAFPALYSARRSRHTRRSPAAADEIIAAAEKVF